MGCLSRVREAILILAVLSSVSGLLLPGVCQAQGSQAERAFGKLEQEAQSRFSRIRIRRAGNIRTMTFLRDSGAEVGESRMNLKAPHQLIVPYTQFMFASYLYKPRPQRVLMVGLGGGSMVRFVQHHEPEVKLDVVEIDPEVVRLAAEYFGARSSKNVNVITADGAEYLRKTPHTYDVIYMDAFLKPSTGTDTVGVPRHLKTAEFYQQAKQKVARDGVMMFNVNVHPRMTEDLRALKAAFPHVHLFRSSRHNLVAAGIRADAPIAPKTLRKNASDSDRRLKANFSIRRILGRRSTRIPR